MASQAIAEADEFLASTKQLNAVSEHCLRHINIALRENGATQIPSYVTEVPTGQEQGVFLAVDLGGTNCRICSVYLHGDRTYTMKQKKHAIPPHLMVNDSHRPLFDYVAERIKAFLEECSQAETPTAAKVPKSLQLGFTFSFTYESHSICHGTMLQWDKGWDIPDALGRDPLQMLQEAIDRLKLSVAVVALTNDSVGALMGSAYTTGSQAIPLIGAILGTGTNAAYIERLQNVRKLHAKDGSYRHAPMDKMIINTEWGAWFDDNFEHLPTNQYDEALDKASVNPGVQLFEKRVSGMYLGELARLAIVALMDKQKLDMQIEKLSPLLEPYSLGGSVLTLLAEMRSETDKGATANISTTLGVTQLSTSDLRIFGILATAIVRRSARLSAAAMAAIVTQSQLLGYANPFWKRLPYFWNRILRTAFSSLRILCGSTYDRENSAPTARRMINIGIDGSLFELYPYYEKDIREALSEMRSVGTYGEKQIRIVLAKDGSSLGAALIAQSLTKTTQQIA